MSVRLCWEFAASNSGAIFDLAKLGPMSLQLTTRSNGTTTVPFLWRRRSLGLALSVMVYRRGRDSCRSRTLSLGELGVGALMRSGAENPSFIRNIIRKETKALHLLPTTQLPIVCITEGLTPGPHNTSCSLSTATNAHIINMAYTVLILGVSSPISLQKFSINFKHIPSESSWQSQNLLHFFS